MIFNRKKLATLTEEKNELKFKNTELLKEKEELRKEIDSKKFHDLGGLYHDYSFFGYENTQLEGIYAPNQQCKGPILTAYIQLALAKTKQKLNDDASFIELFCADGYYAMLAKHLGATKSAGLDDDSQGYFNTAKEICKRMNLTNVEFIKEDVNNIDKLQRFDIVANVGGLYHISNPKEIIEKSYQLAKKYLIVQTVVSMANSDEDYFESPAPEWTWGSRYNKYSFDKMIRSLGYNIIDSHFNELEGNERLEDRGSVYYLIEK